MGDGNATARPGPLSQAEWLQVQYDAWWEAWCVLDRRAADYVASGDEPRAVVMRAIAASAKTHAADLGLRLVNRPER